MTVELKKISLDMQSLIQWLLAIGAIIAFTITQTSRITALESSETNNQKIQEQLQRNQDILIASQKTMIDIFNNHLVQSATKTAEFEALREEIHLMEIKTGYRNKEK